jgi:hypothetical protein
MYGLNESSQTVCRASESEHQAFEVGVLATARTYMFSTELKRFLVTCSVKILHV